MRYFIGRKHGIWLEPTGPYSSYRPFWKQVDFYRNYQNGTGPLAAYPGQSNHGWGRAVDIPGAKMQEMVRRYGHKFGWGIAGGQLSSDAPSEPWHCTYRGPYTSTARMWFWRHRAAAKRKRGK